MKKRNILRDQRGEAYADMAITILIIFAFLASMLSIYPLYTTYQTINSTARQMARLIEVTGQADDATLAAITGREGFVVPDKIKIDTVYFDESLKRIQLKQPFTITIEKDVVIPIIRPVASEPIGIRIRVSASSSGISEVYWKRT